MRNKRLILGFTLVALAFGYIELRLPSPVAAQGQDAVFQRLAVTGTAKLESFRGQISAFNSACPADWDELTALRGRVIVGLVDGGTLAQSVGTALTNGESRRGGTKHPGPYFSHTGANSARSPAVIPYSSAGIRIEVDSSAAGVRIIEGLSRTGSLNQKLPAPYVQLRYCEYQP